MDDLVFLFDVDNTLLDNDAVQADLRAHLLNELRRGSGAALLGDSRRVCAASSDTSITSARSNATGAEDLHNPRLLRMSSWLVDYPFADRLYPGALEVVGHVRQWGRPVVLSDGDAVFQPRKVERSGIWKAFEDAILIYIHKEEELADVERLYPAERYVLIDDKLRILTAVKAIWGDRVTTVFPRQGHYANDPKALAACPPADVQVDRIGIAGRRSRRFAPR